MAATRCIEEERGTYVGFVHQHNGYYAGDFSRRDLRGVAEHGAGSIRRQPTPATGASAGPTRRAESAGD